MLSKSDIIEMISKKYFDTRAKTEKVVSEIFDIIKNSLINDEKVSITDFGVFETKKCNERTCRNPKTGEKIIVPERKRVQFRLSQNFKNNLNKVDDKN